MRDLFRSYRGSDRAGQPTLKERKADGVRVSFHLDAPGMRQHQTCVPIPSSLSRAARPATTALDASCRNEAGAASERCFRVDATASADAAHASGMDEDRRSDDEPVVLLLPRASSAKQKCRHAGFELRQSAPMERSGQRHGRHGGVPPPTVKQAPGVRDDGALRVASTGFDGGATSPPAAGSRGSPLQSAQRDAVASGDEMLVGASKEVSAGVPDHQCWRILTAVRQPRIDRAALLSLVQGGAHSSSASRAR